MAGNGDPGCHKTLQGPVHRCGALATVFYKVRDVGGTQILPCDTHLNSAWPRSPGLS